MPLSVFFLFLHLFLNLFPAAQWSLSNRSTVFSKAVAIFDLSSNQYSQVVLEGRRPTLFTERTASEVGGSAAQAKTSTRSWGKRNTGSRKQEMRGRALPRTLGYALEAPFNFYQLWVRQGWCRWAASISLLSRPAWKIQNKRSSIPAPDRFYSSWRKVTVHLLVNWPWAVWSCRLPDWTIEEGSPCFLTSGRPSRVS